MIQSLSIETLKQIVVVAKAYVQQHQTILEADFGEDDSNPEKPDDDDDNDDDDDGVERDSLYIEEDDDMEVNKCYISPIPLIK
jgi:hypothetical protein